MYRLLVGLGVLFSTDAAYAATIDHQTLEGGTEAISIVGDLQPGDELKFRKLAVQYESAVVALSSNGGALLPAMEIGRAVHIRGFNTVVLGGYQCASACALIWVAGGTRYLSRGGRVGFHASYIEEGGKTTETGLGNALVGRYLTQLDLPEKAIVFATQEHPNSIAWLADEGDAAVSGIAFNFLQNKHDLAAPTNPTKGGWRVAASGRETFPLVFVDTDHVKRDKQNVRFWADLWYLTSGPGTNRSVSYVSADCGEHQVKMLETLLFHDETPNGQAPPYTQKFATPDSVLGGAIDAVCQQKYLTGAIGDRLAAVAKLKSNTH